MNKNDFGTLATSENQVLGKEADLAEACWAGSGSVGACSGCTLWWSQIDE